MATLEQLTCHAMEMAGLSPQLQGRANRHEGRNKKHTQDGSLDWHGRPAQRETTGGWHSAILILVNQGLSMLAFVGLEVSLVLFSTRVLKQSNAEVANTFSRWMGASYLSSLIGAFLSDAYLGRYQSCFVFEVILTVGMGMLSLTTAFLLLKPSDCGKLELPCNSQSSFEMAMFYISIYLVALGSGACEPSLAAFGSDQFDKEHARENAAKQSFYSYFYVATNLGSLLSSTVIAYLQNSGQWTLGYWISTYCAFLSCIILLSGSMRYRHFKTCGNPLSRFCQVVVAAWKKSKIELPSHEEDFFEVHTRDDTTHGGRKILHSKGFRFLDHAAIVTFDDTVLAPGNPPNPWNLCTVTQVEEVKCMLRLLPIWLCSIFFSVIFVQMDSLFIEQGAAMKTTISGFHMPPASMKVFAIMSVSGFIFFNDKLVIPLYTKITRTIPKGLSDLKKMRIGLIIAAFAMITAGITELLRLKKAEVTGPELSSLSISWQIPQYILIGVAESFVFIGQLEFFSSQTPNSLKTLGIGLCISSNFIGSYISSFLLTVVMKITTKNGNPGWIASNLNEGHLDRFFFLMAALTVEELSAYIWCASYYKCISLDRREETEERD